MVIYSKTSLNRPTMEPTLNGPFREVVCLVRLCLQWISWDPNKAIDIEGWSICGCGRIERFYCILVFHVITHVLKRSMYCYVSIVVLMLAATDNSAMYVMPIS